MLACCPGLDNFVVLIPNLLCGGLTFKDPNIDFPERLMNLGLLIEQFANDGRRFQCSFKWRGEKGLDVFIS